MWASNARRSKYFRGCNTRSVASDSQLLCPGPGKKIYILVRGFPSPKPRNRVLQNKQVTKAINILLGNILLVGFLSRKVCHCNQTWRNYFIKRARIWGNYLLRFSNFNPLVLSHVQGWTRHLWHGMSKLEISRRRWSCSHECSVTCNIWLKLITHKAA